MNNTFQTPATLTPPSLPKGGGALTSMGDTPGQAGPDGMAGFTVPLPVSAGRGVAPALTLSYSSGAGNDVFGMGWGCATPAIRRRSQHGVPQYTAADEFLSPGGEVMVPEQDEQGQPVISTVTQYGSKTLGQPYSVTHYLPRIEGDFHRIEYWLGADGQAFWMLHERSGMLHLLGKTAAGRISDPMQPAHVAVWLLEESVSPTGEHIWYHYVAEDRSGLTDMARDHQANRYLDSVHYGNVTAAEDLYLWDADAPTAPWLFTLVFDYGQRTTGSEQIPPFVTQESWPVRQDAFSRYDYGFEVRTHRLCHQVLMFHHFPEDLGEAATLVSRLLLEYQQEATLSRLTAVQRLAYEPDGTLQSEPPLDLRWSPFTLTPPPSGWQPLPALGGLNDGQRWQLVDLYGEGIPGILYRTGQDWYYRAPVRATGGVNDAVDYADWQVLPQVPSMQDGRHALLDLTGDGRLDWLVTQPGLTGFFTLNPDGQWSAFTPFSALPTEFFHPQAQLNHLVGSGLADLALIGPKSVRLYANQGAGFSAGIDVAQGDNVTLPVAGRDARELVAFADILGSGQPHLVRVRHNSVTCWPNLGRGRFGAPLTLAITEIDTETAFDPDRVFLADIDGSGAADLVYARHDKIDIYLNQSGNGFAPPVSLPLPAGVKFDALSQLSLADIQGTGMTELILTVPNMTPRHWHCAFAQAKPYLLTGVNNNQGADTTLHYRSSAQFWLDEKQENPQAVPALPLVMPLLSQTTAVDEVTGNTLKQQVRYRAGVYDGREREFRGFGYLETEDTHQDAQPAGVNTPLAATLLTKSWYHCGREDDERRLYGKTWSDDSGAPALKSTRLTQFTTGAATETALTPDDTTRWWLFRALKGSLLRSETFGLDGSAGEDVPYGCAFSRLQVRLVQAGQIPVVMPGVLEQVTLGYERLADDPQTAHQVILETDRYGSVLWQVGCAYPRRPQNKMARSPEGLPDSAWASSYDAQQQVLRLSESRAAVINRTETEIWLPGLPSEQRSNTLTFSSLPEEGVSYESLTQPGGLLAPETPRLFTGQQEIIYQSVPPDLKALVDHVRTAVLDDIALQAYEGLDFPGEVDFVALGYVAVPTVLNPGTASATVQAVESGFTVYHDAGKFWCPYSSRTTKLTGSTTVEYDAYTVAVVKSTDALDNSVTAEIDYRFLVPWRVTDINDNISEVQLDALGRVVNTSVYGTESGGQSVGFAMVSDYPVPPTLTVDEAITSATAYHQQTARIDVSDGFSWMGQVQRAQLSADPFRAEQDWQTLLTARFIMPDGRVRSAGHRWVTDEGRKDGETTFPVRLTDVLAQTVRIPVHSVTLLADNYPDKVDQQTRISLDWQDGFGRPLQQCMRVAAGESWLRLENGELATDAQGQPVTGSADPRWAVSGRVEYDNKGQPVRQYQPFFIDSWRYVADTALRAHGYSDTLFYDAPGRVAQVVTAAGYLRRQRYYPWFTVSEDENDTQGQALPLLTGATS